MLGFGAPIEASGASNSNLGSLKHVLNVYQVQYTALLKKHEEKEAADLARDFMQRYEFNSEPLGKPRSKDGQWMYCGLIDDEESLPDELKGSFCGGCFHLGCAGLVQLPKATSGRLACMYCLSDRRHRPKPPQGARLQEQVMYRENRTLRMLHLDPDPIPSAKLICSCSGNIGSGIPCAGMLAVAHHVSCVLHYSCIHQHWISHTIVDVVRGEAAFEGNQALTLDVDAVIEEKLPQIPPSTLAKSMSEPRGIMVRASKRAATVVSVTLTQSAPGGRDITKVSSNNGADHLPVELDSIVPPPKPPLKKSRRYKPKLGKSGKQKKKE